MPDFFWTNEADRQYLKYAADDAVRKCLDELIEFIEDDPHRGIEICLLELSSDPWESRAAKALRDAGIIADARLVLANVQYTHRRNEPPTLGAVVHTSTIPSGVQADHSLVTMGLVLTTNRFA